MANEKAKIKSALGISWVGVALATAITCYGTHAGPKHPNPAIVLMTLMLMAGGLAPAFIAAKKKSLVALQVGCGIVFGTVVFALNQETIGPNWPAYTSIATALILSIVSVISASLMGFGTPANTTSSDATS